MSASLLPGLSFHGIHHEAVVTLAEIQPSTAVRIYLKSRKA